MDINCNYHEGLNNYCRGIINVETQSRFSIFVRQSKADLVQMLILYGYIISLASYPKDLILYFERFKFPYPGHPGLLT
jgi:hypothetical protein